MDNKKLIKQFIVEMSYWFEYKLRTERHTNFLYELNNEMAWLVADKAIDIRIRNRLLKEYGIKAEVTYELKPSANVKAKPTIVGTKKIIAPARILIREAFAAFLISSSLLATTAFPKSIIPKIIINRGITILKTLKILPTKTQIDFVCEQKLTAANKFIKNISFIHTMIVLKNIKYVKFFFYSLTIPNNLAALLLSPTGLFLSKPNLLSNSSKTLCLSFLSSSGGIL